jgi:hypothetical protein
MSVVDLNETEPDLYVPKMVAEIESFLVSQIPPTLASAQERTPRAPPANHEEWVKKWEYEAPVKFPLNESRHYETFFAGKTSGT